MGEEIKGYFLAYRHGGGAFALVSWEASWEEACDAAEALRTAIEGLRIEHRHSEARVGNVLTASVGCLHAPRGSRIEAADFEGRLGHLVYEAKRLGRNLVVSGRIVPKCERPGRARPLDGTEMDETTDQ